MKKFIAPLILCGLMYSCADSKNRYLDLSTGEKVEVMKDDKTGYMINKATGKPLYIYVDTKKDDTIYGKTGEVINGHVVKSGDNKWVFEGDDKLKLDDGQVKYKDGDYKVKVEDDGDIKIKNGDDKIKIDDGERKKKND